jgi:hypothetical protein
VERQGTPWHEEFALTCTDGSGCHSSVSSVTSSAGLLVRRSSVRARRGPLRFLLPPCTFGVIRGEILALLEPVFGPIGREPVGEPVQRPLQRPAGQHPWSRYEHVSAVRTRLEYPSLFETTARGMCSLGIETSRMVHRGSPVRGFPWDALPRWLLGDVRGGFLSGSGQYR